MFFLRFFIYSQDSKNLDEFIMTKDREVDFDVDIAISVCRQAGYFR